MKDGWVGVEDHRIVHVGKSQGGVSSDIVLRGEGRVVLPGLINAHTHMVQALARGVGDDLQLYPWLRRIWKFQRGLTDKEVYAGTLLAAVESVKTGTTCVVNHQYQPIDRSSVLMAVEALNRVGLRCVVVRGCQRVMAKAAEKHRAAATDFHTSSEAVHDLRVTEELMREVNAKQRGLVRVWPGFANILDTTPELILKTQELAQRHNTGIHTHIAEERLDPILYKREFGSRPIEALYNLGVLSPLFHVVHGNWLSKREIGLLGKAKGCVVHNPVSNMYLATGIAPIPHLLKAGATIALGSDGPASNNNQDMFAVMKTTALLHKAVNRDPTIMTAPEVLRMATVDGARVLGLEGQIGVIQQGTIADLTVVNVRNSHTYPIHNTISSLVYCCQGGDVESTIIDGKLVVQNGKMQRVDEEQVLNEAQRAMDVLLDRAEFSPSGRGL